MNNALNTDLYEVLGVDPDADADTISRAYRALARELHPDLNPDDVEAEERFKSVTAAYDVLADPDKRAEYDQFQAMAGSGFTGDAFFADGSAGPDLSDLLGGLFGGGFSGGGFSGARFDPGSFPRHGSDFRMGLPITFDQAVEGATTTVTVPGADGPRPVQVRLPAGVDDGQVVRVPGGGGPGANGGPAGDLYLEVSVGTHPRFGRRGRHLTVDAPVGFADAVLGTELQVTTYDGDRVTIRVPAGTPSGRTFRVRGRGIAGGDLLVTVVIDVPSGLDDDQRAAVEALRDAFADHADAA